MKQFAVTENSLEKPKVYLNECLKKYLDIWMKVIVQLQHSRQFCKMVIFAYNAITKTIVTTSHRALGQLV